MLLLYWNNEKITYILWRNFMQVFIHDPLYKWALSPLKALQRQKVYQYLQSECLPCLFSSRISRLWKQLEIVQERIVYLGYWKYKMRHHFMKITISIIYDFDLRSAFMHCLRVCILWCPNPANAVKSIWFIICKHIKWWALTVAAEYHWLPVLKNPLI